MKHPYEKFIRMELLALVSVVFCIILAFVKDWLPLIFISLFFLQLSIVSNGLALLYTNQKSPAMKQLIRGILVFVLTVYLIFHL